MSLIPLKGSPLAELPDSPKYRLTTEKNSQVRTFQGTWTAVQAATVAPGNFLDGLKCVDCAVEKLSGERGQLTVTCEVGGSGPGGGAVPLPDDEWSFSASEIGPPLVTHPKFSSGLTALTEDQISAAENTLKSDDPVARAAWRAAVAASSSVPLTNYARLRLKGVETYYQVSLSYVWTARYYALPTLVSGGIIETPFGPGWFAVSGLGWSWLRQMDVPSYSGGIYTVVRTWLGAPNGHWDAYLYA